MCQAIDRLFEQKLQSMPVEVWFIIDSNLVLITVFPLGN